MTLYFQKDQKYWLIDITPEIKTQIRMIDSFNCSLAGIFITHAHIGHYLGLLELGLEVMNTSRTPVYVMSKMKSFLEKNSSILNDLADEHISKMNWFETSSAKSDMKT